MKLSKKEKRKHDAWIAGLAMVIVAGGFLFVGYWIGLLNTNFVVIQPQLFKPTASLPTSGSGGNSSAANIPYYSDVSTWQADHFDVSKMSISYPIDFDTQKGFTKDQSADWRVNMLGGPGTKVFTLTIPKSFIPQSNFNEATLTVGRSSNNIAMVNCLKPDEDVGPNAVGTPVSINGQTFTVFHSSGIGAGNIYDTTSYRIEHAGQCYSIEYTIHTSQLGNYPQEYQLKEADTAKVRDLMDRIIGTAKFD
ncbi:MAG: hypothetical protein WC477_04000 [Patescibacteria group bacterium]